MFGGGGGDDGCVGINVGRGTDNLFFYAGEMQSSDLY